MSIPSSPSPIFTMTGNDFVHAFFNTLKIYAAPAAGFIVAFSVNQVAHAIFTPKQGSKTSHAIKAISFLVGSAASIYVATKNNFTTFTGKKIFELLAVDIVCTLIIRSLDLQFGSGLSGGAFVGWLGSRVMTPFSSLLGVGGAGVGAFNNSASPLDTIILES